MGRNCWTCAYDRASFAAPVHLCSAPVHRAATTAQITAWTEAIALDAQLMPPKDADGCPGYKERA